MEFLEGSSTPTMLRPSALGVGGESNLLPQFSRSEMCRLRDGYGSVKEDLVISLLSGSRDPQIYLQPFER